MVDLDRNSDAVEPAEQLYRDHVDVVTRVCRRALGPSHDADDAVQEVFMRAVRQEAWTHEAPRAWLIVVARRVCADMIRERVSQAHKVEALGRGADGAVDCEDEAISNIVRRGYLALLTPTERRVAMHRLVHDSAYSTVASDLGISLVAARKAFSRARLKIVDHLREAAVGVLVLAGLDRWQRGRRWLEALNPLGEQAPALLAVPAAALLCIVALVPLARDTPAGPAPARPAGSISWTAPAAPPAVTGTSTSPAATGSVPGPPAGGGAPAPGTPGATAAVPGADPAAIAQAVAPPPPTQQRARPLDVQASPRFDADHSVLEVGVAPDCARSCTALFRSDDGGRTWRTLTATGLTGTRLLLPAGGFAAGRFYAVGPAGLEQTLDGGSTFITVLPGTLGFFSPAGVDTGADVAISNTAIWLYRPGSATATLFAALPPGVVAAGSAQFAGPVARVPVRGATGALGVEECRLGGVCTSYSGTVPLPGATAELAQSPDGTTVLIYNGAGAASSTRPGSFTAAPLGARVGVQGAVVSVGGGFHRIMAMLFDTRDGTGLPTVVSDDGTHWSAIASAAGTGYRLGGVTVLGTARLLGVLFNPSLPGSSTAVECSLDGGATWSAC